MTDPRESSRTLFLAQLERYYQGQRNAHMIQAPCVPRNDDFVSTSTECIPEEPMGNEEPRVHCETEHPSSIANPFGGDWA
mgnify:CR=1 FL=1